MNHIALALTSSLCIYGVLCGDVAERVTNNQAGRYPFSRSGIKHDYDYRRSVVVWLTDQRGIHLGSGVFVRSARAGFWIATNRHVVDGLKSVCVIGGDLLPTAATVVHVKGSAPDKDIDLAFLWIADSVDNKYRFRVPGKAVVGDEKIPVIVATGYPSLAQERAQKPVYRESEGLLLPLFKQTLQGGFSLAYTADVQKGMSGGGLFVGNRLIGINGAHARPLWFGYWRDKYLRPVSEDLNKKLELVSLGIGIDLIESALDSLKTPVLASSFREVAKNCAELIR